MFQQTRIKLTAWYLLIIMVISVLFSVVIFTEANRELNRFERIQLTRVEFERSISQALKPPRPPMLNPEEIREARMRLIFTLILINGGILVFSGAAGYFLAGKTLRPIKKSMDEQNRFIADASHELRTPLTSLRCEIEVALRNKSLTPKEAKTLLESNLEEVVSLQVLSDNLLLLAQNGKHINSSHMQNLELKMIVDKAIKKLTGLSKSKQIIIENKVKHIKVKGVVDRLTEVFVILLDNAIKYSPNKGRVEITSQLEGNKAEVKVIDHGTGIEKEDLPHIFDRFYRASKSRSGTEGYGLGLSIAKKIVESHNGKITVESTDKGTSFTVVLPA